MNSNLFDAIGIGTVDPAYYVIGLLVLCIVLFIINMVSSSKVKKLYRKYERFLLGKNAETLEETILKRFEEVEALKESDNASKQEIIKINENLSIVYQKMGIVKYDAFNEMGGKLSFSLALLNGQNTGFVMNAMHSREGCYTYIKEIIRGESYIPLGEEEKAAVDKAIKNE